ncbi:alpha-2 adrenergic receptor [Trichonephila clavipes]|nr:alpha-2 adrenergic receptor [Trichonephila clavipes]
MKIGNNGNLVLGSFDESTPCLMIVLMNCQTKLRINHLTAVKSVAILENPAKLVSRTAISGSNNSTFTPGYRVEQRLDGMYRSDRDYTKHGCDYMDDVKRTLIHVKKKFCLAIRASRFIVDHPFEDAPTGDTASKKVTAIVSELEVHAAASVVELFVQILFVLRTTLILD